MTIYNDRIPDCESYNQLRVNSGKGSRLSDEVVHRLFAGSLYYATAYDGDRLVGLIRVVGDGAVTFAVTDVMVDRAYQRRGIADSLMEEIDAYFQSQTDENSFVMLIARKPYDGLYLKHGFDHIQPEYRVAMLREQGHTKL